MPCRRSAGRPVQCLAVSSPAVAGGPQALPRGSYQIMRAAADAYARSQGAGDDDKNKGSSVTPPKGSSITPPTPTPPTGAAAEAYARSQGAGDEDENKGSSATSPTPSTPASSPPKEQSSSASTSDVSHLLPRPPAMQACHAIAQ